MSDAPSFGHWLRQRRRRHDLTQAELAKLVGYAVGTLRNIETDDARPSKQLAAKLARVLGVADDDIDAVVAFARGRGPVPDTPAPASEVAPAAPALPARSARRANLPGQLTGLIGRAAETEAVRALLLRPDVRLVTLTGPGGIGKTRVAVESAMQLLDAFPDGVTFVDLAAITDPRFVLATIAQTIGVTAHGGQPLQIYLAAMLQDQARLLLLDNFEQVIDAAASVAELLGACPQLNVLITSRIVLGVAGEHEWPVPPLALPDRANPPSFEQLTQYEAVRLFTERARAANTRFVITTSNAPAIAEICHQLDGLPLAIELAAARVKLFAPQALLARLDHRLTFLTGGARDRPNRQQTIRNTIDWSYQLLTSTEQTLFRCLSVFVGGGTLPAIEVVCRNDDLTSSVVSTVAALVDHSLLYRTFSADEPTHATADSRFGMFETIREYALEQFAADPNVEMIRRQHAHYYLALAQAATVEWSTSRMAATAAQLRREHDNMRAALQWALDRGQGIVGLELAEVLWGFWRSYGYIGEGRAWLEQLLALDEHLSDSAAIAARQRALHAAAWLASDQHDYATAASLFEQRMALRRALGETEEEIDLLLNAAREARATGHYQQATALLERVLARYRAVRDPTQIESVGQGLSFHQFGQTVRELALVRRELGDFEQAVALFEEGLQFHQAIGDRASATFDLMGLGDVARDQGNSSLVRQYYEPNLMVLRTIGMQWAIGFALNSLALAALHESDLTRAWTFIDESVTLFRGLDAVTSLSEVLVSQGQILHALGDSTATLAALSEALRLAQAVGPHLFVAMAMEGLSSVLVAQDQAQQAVQLLATASAIRAKMGTPARPVDQPGIARAVESARAALGAEAIAAAWAEAEALSLEQLLRAYTP